LDQELKFKLPIKENSDRDKVRFNKRVFIYLFFLFIAILFWYLNALGKNYVTDIHYNVQYQNFPKGKILISDLPVEITVKVEGIGFQILKYKISSFYESIDLNLSEFKIDINSNNSQYDYFLLTRYAKNRIKTMFNGLDVLKVYPDTLFFRFTDVYDKKVAVRPALNITFEKQYMVHGKVVVIPDSITISGPKNIIDTLQFISTNEIYETGLKDTFITDIYLKSIPKFIVPDKKVKVFIPVDKFTEVVYQIPIECENKPLGIDIKTFPSSITLSCLVPVTDFDKINSEMFTAAIDYNKIAELKPEKIKVNLVKVPTQIYNIKFHPKTVEYIIEK
jgi:hypothetical protein